MMQPYFYYSAVSMMAAFLAIKIVLRIGGFCSHRVLSCLYSVPLLAPLFIFIFFTPKLEIISDLDSEGFSPMIGPGDLHPMIGSPSSVGPFISQGPGVMFSYTGMICIIGLCLAMLTFVICLLPHDRMFRKSGVIICCENDFPEVQALVWKCATKLDLNIPKIGIMEDLRPNAFIIGRRNRSTIVFTLGMLGSFTPSEMEATIAHEMMHLRHNDQLFRSTMMALNALSFYNPLAYLSARSALREREHWADTGSICEGYPSSELESALRKVSASTAGAVAVASIGLPFRSPIKETIEKGHRLSFHPSVDERIESIKRPERGCGPGWKYAVLSVITIAMIFATLMVSFQDARAYMEPHHDVPDLASPSAMIVPWNEVSVKENSTPVPDMGNYSAVVLPVQP